MGNSFSLRKDTPKYITELARKNRINPTLQEEKLWLAISSKKLKGLKFRRQYPIGRYIVDFYNHDNRLVIEIDGSIHDATKEYDGNRDDYLHARGYTIIRFTNSEIETNIEMVVQRIVDFINSRHTPPKSPAGGLEGKSYGKKLFTTQRYSISPPAGDLGGVTESSPSPSPWRIPAR